ncbi:MAG: polyprenyl synthetase family protein [Bacteroidales bacterium]|nr:polyprenyl synthetase family protein [Bacteroidales bacterium]
MYSLKELQQRISDIFQQEKFLATPTSLYEPIDYTLSLGGKRIRPLLLLASCQLFGGDIEQAKDAALGIETYHNFTLLHDDLMDQSPIRRGQPTVYRKWSPNTAILSGDAMISLAWRYFLRQPHPQLQSILNLFNETCIQITEGQQYDMDFEQRQDVTTAEYLDMIRLKTAVLLAGALKIGALYANASPTNQEYIYQYGIHLGLAFQLQDDLLDAYGDVSILGKQTGTDICDNKKTYLYLQALAAANPEQHNLLTQLYSTKPTDNSAKISQILDLYQQLGIKQSTEQVIEQEFNQALHYLQLIDTPDQNKEPLLNLGQKLLHRDS